MVWPFLLVTLSLFTPGSLTQSSHPVDEWSETPVTVGKGSRSNIPDSLSSEVIFLAERRQGSLEGSGQTVDGSALQTHVHHKVLPEVPRPAGKSLHCTRFLTQ